MVYIAHAMGDAIKFQMHVLENEMLRDVPTSDNFDEPLYDTLKNTELTLNEHKELQRFVIPWALTLCTPFSAKAVDILDVELGISVQDGPW